MSLTDETDCLCHVELLGPLRVTCGGKTHSSFATQKSAALIAYLALHIGPHPRERVIDLLWPDMELSAGRNNLSTTLVSVRRQIEPPGTRRGSVLVTSQAEVGFNPDTVTSDAAIFEDLLKRAARADSADVRAELLTRAVSLYRGDILAGSYQDWALRETERVRTRLQTALGQLAKDQESLGDHSGALQTMQRSEALDPYSEEIHCRLIRLYVQTGQLAAAKEANRRFERLFADEFGADLSDEARADIARIFAQPAPTARSRRSLFPPDTESGTSGMPLQRRPPQVYATEERSAPILPVALGQYFGREAEIIRLVRLLVPSKGIDLDGPEIPCRLATLTGPGGLGKTRLSIEFARRVSTRFSLWCGFVSLADLTHAAQIPDQIAADLKLTPDKDGDPIASICAFLNSQDHPGQPPLLILDNLEHLLPQEDSTDTEVGVDETAISCIKALLSRVPGLTMLCTSRRRAGLRGEQVISLEPLQVPDRLPDNIDDECLAALAEVPSVRLYVDRAQSARPDFGLTTTNAPAVAALCRQLEGSPLALELAAAWVRVLPPRKMWERLTQGHDIPPGSYADLPARHRTLSAAMDWSFRLLTHEQAVLFTRLHIFRGGWTLESAEVVCRESNALMLLSALQEASLVTATFVDGNDSQVRYAFLETVRAFSRRQAELCGEVGEIEQAHLVCFLNFAEHADTKMRGAELAYWLTQLENEHDNLRAALNLCLSDSDNTERIEFGARMICALFRFWTIRGHWSETKRYIGMVSDTTEASLPVRLRARLSNVRASYMRLIGDLGTARTLFEASLKSWRELGDRKSIAALLHNLGLVCMTLGEYERARPFYQESLELSKSLEDQNGIADELHHLGWVAHELGDIAQARLLYEESLEIRRPLGDLRGGAFTLQNLANIAVSEGDYHLAESIQRDNLTIRRELLDMPGTAAALLNLGNYADQQSDPKSALQLYREALEIFAQLGDLIGVSGTVDQIASIAVTDGRLEHAVRLLSALETLRTQAGLPVLGDRADRNKANIELMKQKLSGAEFAKAWQAGSALSWEQAAAAAIGE